MRVTDRAPSTSVRAVGRATGGCVVVNLNDDDGIIGSDDYESDGGRDGVDAIRGERAVLDLGGPQNPVHLRRGFGTGGGARARVRR